MPNLLTLVPFRERHFAAIRETLGEGWTIEAHLPKDQSTPNAIAFGGTELSPEELYDALLRADAVIGEPDPAILRRAVDAGAPIKLLQMTWAGTDKYTRSAVAFPAGVTLCNAVGTFGQLISQYSVAQALSIMQNLHLYRDEQAKSHWSDLGPVASLDGAEVLIFGAGNIAGYIARRLAGFDCHITGVCRHTDKPREGFDALVTLAEAEALLADVDVAFCALPNNNDTAGWFSAKRLRALKPGAVIVNVGRGNFIDCAALADVLAEGHLRGAALDVTSPEPLPVGHPLWTEPRCVITPHVSGGSFGRNAQTEDNLCRVCCTNLAALVNGGEFVNAMPAGAFDVTPT